MSIDDDYFEVAEHVKGTNVEEAFDRFSTYTKEYELDNDRLRKRNEQLETTIRTMMGLVKNG